MRGACAAVDWAGHCPITVQYVNCRIEVRFVQTGRTVNHLEIDRDLFDRRIVAALPAAALWLQARSGGGAGRSFAVPAEHGDCHWVRGCAPVRLVNRNAANPRQ